MLNVVLSLALLLLAVVLHEVSHGWVALRLGDTTAKAAGRLTLNPLAHLDLMGTVIVPGLLILAHLPPVGWAKPVPVNFGALRQPKRDMVLVGMAGPLANILLAVLFAALFHLSVGLHFKTGILIGYLGLWINLLLAVFNLMPIPPLDGSRFVLGLLPPKWGLRYLKLEPFGFLILLALIYAGLLEKTVLPIVGRLAGLLGAA
ncbi:MAG: site-2 protease family protein [Candidatus Omnitrophica bacterium]|nr:site-2 protease family protein [Candidatus Omnitrophota bacterium]